MLLNLKSLKKNRPPLTSNMKLRRRVVVPQLRLIWWNLLIGTLNWKYRHLLNHGHTLIYDPTWCFIILTNLENQDTLIIRKFTIGPKCLYYTGSVVYVVLAMFIHIVCFGLQLKFARLGHVISSYRPVRAEEVVIHAVNLC